MDKYDGPTLTITLETAEGEFKVVYMHWRDDDGDEDQDDHERPYIIEPSGHEVILDGPIQGVRDSHGVVYDLEYFTGSCDHRHLVQ